MSHSLASFSRSDSRDAVYAAIASAAMTQRDNFGPGQHYSLLVYGFAKSGVSAQYETLFNAFGNAIATGLSGGSNENYKTVRMLSKQVI